MKAVHCDRRNSDRRQGSWMPIVMKACKRNRGEVEVWWLAL